MYDYEYEAKIRNACYLYEITMCADISILGE